MSSILNVPPEARQFVPVIARALELGEGPPGLLRWLSGRDRTPDASPTGLHRLAVELASAVRSSRAAGPARASSTVLFNRYDTIAGTAIRRTGMDA
jgi:hypothetical protein